MLINQDFTQDRTKYIGGSDIGAILGLSKFRTPLAVWMEKTGKEVPKIDSLPLRFGSFAEEFVASEYVRETSYALLHDELIHTHPRDSFMAAHIDRFVLGEDKSKPPIKILECKTANPFSQSDWGEEKSDQVPMSYLCQCIWYMAITNINQVDLAVLFGNSDFRIYEISRDTELENIVLHKAKTFWMDYVQQDRPPPTQSEFDCQTLFRQGNTSKSVEAKHETNKLIQRLQLLNEEICTRESEVSSIKQIIMNEMADSEILTYEGRLIATWKAPKPSYRINTKKLESELPKIYEQYKVPIQNSRRLNIKW